MKKSLISVPIAALVVAALVGAAAPPHTGSQVGHKVTVKEFAQHLRAERSDPEVADSLAKFEALPADKQEELVQIISDPNFLSEFMDFDVSQSTTLADREVEVDSSIYPDAVTYVSEVEISPDAGPVGMSRAFGSGVGGLKMSFPANSTQTVTATSTANILGIDVTRLKIWVTFKTAKLGIPSAILSSGSSAMNLNFPLAISSQNLKPYIDSSKGLAVAQTVWTASAVVKGLTGRFDKLDTMKAFNGGLYSHTLVNR